MLKDALCYLAIRVEQYLKIPNMVKTEVLPHGSALLSLMDMLTYPSESHSVCSPAYSRR